MNEIIFLIEEAVEGGFTARALGESIFTEAETLDTLRQQVRDAVREQRAREVDRLPASPTQLDRRDLHHPRK